MFANRKYEYLHKNYIVRLLAVIQNKKSLKIIRKIETINSEDVTIGFNTIKKNLN